VARTSRGRTTGFHVYRGQDAAGPFERLTGALVVGTSHIHGWITTHPWTCALLQARRGRSRRPGRGARARPVTSQTRRAGTDLRAKGANPFHGSIDLGFAIPNRAPVQLCVFDPRGRLVRVLASGEWMAGSHAVRWDGRDATGRSVAAGSYFVRLDTPSAQRSVKVVRLTGD
jgi:hypothetical protein